MLNGIPVEEQQVQEMINAALESNRIAQSLKLLIIVARMDVCSILPRVGNRKHILKRNILC